MTFDVDRALELAAAIRAVHGRLGSHLAPSAELQSDVQAAAARAGVEARCDARLATEGGESVVTWSAVVVTARGQVTAEITGRDHRRRQDVEPDQVDRLWRDAFAHLGIL